MKIWIEKIIQTYFDDRTFLLLREYEWLTEMDDLSQEYKVLQNVFLQFWVKAWLDINNSSLYRLILTQSVDFPEVL